MPKKQSVWPPHWMLATLHARLSGGEDVAANAPSEDEPQGIRAGL